jgi:hypothetical protein
MSGLNHYAYADCNPLKYNDPTGMWNGCMGGGFSTASVSGSSSSSSSAGPGFGIGVALGGNAGDSAGADSGSSADSADASTDADQGNTQALSCHVEGDGIDGPVTVIAHYIASPNTSQASSPAPASQGPSSSSGNVSKKNLPAPDFDPDFWSKSEAERIEILHKQYKKVQRFKKTCDIGIAIAETIRDAGDAGQQVVFAAFCAISFWYLAAAVGLVGTALSADGDPTNEITSTIQAYGRLSQALRGTGLEAHHIIEKRFAERLGLKASQMISVALTPEQHQIFTNIWRQQIPYGTNYNMLTDSQIWLAAQKVYQGYPELLEIAKNTIFSGGL